MFPSLDQPQGGKLVQGICGEFEAQAQRAFDDNPPVQQEGITVTAALACRSPGSRWRMSAALASPRQPSLRH
ncbi:hypothetical protein [Streptomyces triculaminicus]|uniref:hypothetical protein n=1 Tax=Streptomyces triculaminicus TaxID=2816232 RepID=UPI00378DC429